jgi:hypothetical protein
MRRVNAMPRAFPTGPKEPDPKKDREQPNKGTKTTTAPNNAATSSAIPESPKNAPKHSARTFRSVQGPSLALGVTLIVSEEPMRISQNLSGDKSGHVAVTSVKEGVSQISDMIKRNNGLEVARVVVDKDLFTKDKLDADSLEKIVDALAELSVADTPGHIRSKLVAARPGEIPSAAKEMLLMDGIGLTTSEK